MKKGNTVDFNGPMFRIHGNTRPSRTFLWSCGKAVVSQVFNEYILPFNLVGVISGVYQSDWIGVKVRQNLGIANHPEASRRLHDLPEPVMFFYGDVVLNQESMFIGTVESLLVGKRGKIIYGVKGATSWRFFNLDEIGPLDPDRRSHYYYLHEQRSNQLVFTNSAEKLLFWSSDRISRHVTWEGDVGEVYLSRLCSKLEEKYLGGFVFFHYNEDKNFTVEIRELHEPFKKQLRLAREATAGWLAERKARKEKRGGPSTK